MSIIMVKRKGSSGWPVRIFLPHSYEIIMPIHFGSRLPQSFCTGLGGTGSSRGNFVNLRAGYHSRFANACCLGSGRGGGERSLCHRGAIYG